MATNPFNLVYNTLWTMLDEDARFTVKEGNKIHFNEREREPQKTQMSTSDYPQVMLVAEGVTGNLCSTSTTSMLIRRYSWVISSGDFRYDEIFPLEWAIYTGMLAWRYKLSVLEWVGEPFVSRANIVTSNLDQVEKARQRGLAGWHAIWTVEVEMHFTTSVLEGSHLT